jgi:selenocysteine-specific elongation factor
VPARVDRLGSRPLAPGSKAVAQLKLTQSMLLFPGDRLVLRRPSPVNTFAGGEVLDSRLRRWRRRESSGLNHLPGVARDAWHELLMSWVEGAGLEAVSAADLAGRLGVLPAAVEAPLGRLVADGRIHTLRTRPPRMLARARLDELATEASEELKRRLAGQEVSAGVPARDFAGSLLPKKALSLTETYLEELRQRGVFELSEGRVVPAGSEEHMTELGAELTRRVESVYREAGLAPPAPAEVAERLAARPAMVEGICRFLVQRGRFVRLEGKLLIHRAVLDEVARSVASRDEQLLSVGDFKEEFGLTRKLAIPILEWLDSERVTVRQGNNRKIIRRSS